MKTNKEILGKLGIDKLNPMQLAMAKAFDTAAEIMLLSPTGSGKTLAFLLPLLNELKPQLFAVQVLIIVPSRELAIQIEQVLRSLGAGLKVNAVYGGRSVKKDLAELETLPQVLIGTPGRLDDHLFRGTFNPMTVKCLVLDEFDKSLEIGYDKEMTAICKSLTKVKRKLLTSATEGVNVPDFVNFNAPLVLDYLTNKPEKLEIKIAATNEKDKLNGLIQLLQHIGNVPGIVFCNFKESIARVSEVLKINEVGHVTFFGGIEQQDRERALIKFRNGTVNLLLATDLAARGLDIPEIKFIIHYHLPVHEEEFIHRNGRTARMNNEGVAYVLQYQKEKLPAFIANSNLETIACATLKPAKHDKVKKWTTVFISGGRKDKISKGDIAGLLFKEVGLNSDQVGLIELKTDCAFIAIEKGCVKMVVQRLNNNHLKKRKLRVYEI